MHCAIHLQKLTLYMTLFNLEMMLTLLYKYISIYDSVPIYSNYFHLLTFWSWVQLQLQCVNQVTSLFSLALYANFRLCCINFYSPDAKFILLCVTQHKSLNGSMTPDANQCYFQCSTVPNTLVVFCLLLLKNNNK